MCVRSNVKATNVQMKNRKMRVNINTRQTHGLSMAATEGRIIIVLVFSVRSATGKTNKSMTSAFTAVDVSIWRMSGKTVGVIIVGSANSTTTLIVVIFVMEKSRQASVEM